MEISRLISPHPNPPPQGGRESGQIERKPLKNAERQEDDILLLEIGTHDEVY